MQIAVSKALRDNLKGWTDVEVRGSRDQNGQSLIKRLEERKELNHQDPKKYYMGATWYKELKLEFRSESSPQSMLRVDDDSAEINEALHSAMVLYKKRDLELQCAFTLSLVRR